MVVEKERLLLVENLPLAPEAKRLWAKKLVGKINHPINLLCVLDTKRSKIIIYDTFFLKIAKC
jgi:hypothetical protein